MRITGTRHEMVTFESMIPAQFARHPESRDWNCESQKPVNDGNKEDALGRQERFAPRYFSRFSLSHRRASCPPFAGVFHPQGMGHQLLVSNGRKPLGQQVEVECGERLGGMLFDVQVCGMVFDVGRGPIHFK